MRIAFLLGVLAAGTWYSYVAFSDLEFLTNRGRLGPGFFPRIVGLGMVSMTIWVLTDALRYRRDQVEDPGRWSDAIFLICLALIFAVMLRLFGGFVATVIYLALTLSVLNRGRHLQNALVSVLVPIAIYALFDRLLNASMPPALLAFPI